MLLGNVTWGSAGFTTSELPQEIPRDLMNGLREDYSRWRRGARRDEVLVDLDNTCAADSGFELGWEAGIRTPIPWSRERRMCFGALRSALFCSGFCDYRFRLLWSASVCSCAACLIVSHLS